MTEDIRQMSRSLREKAIDKAAEDPQFRQQLIDDPDAAMQAGGFPEVQQIDEMEQNQDVTGQTQCVKYGWTWFCTY